MKRSSRIAVLCVASALVGLVGLGVGYVATMYAKFPNTISHAFSEAPGAKTGAIYPASGAVLWLLHDMDLSGWQHLSYYLHVSPSSGDREYPMMIFSVPDVGRLMDAGAARFEWEQEKPALVFTLGEFRRRIELGNWIEVHGRES